ncbi:sensor histidine kinase [Streptomyces albipurpureus]|uniref:histidine kinase n=1 Tax=Streptomyces albipurpureus TaxID=2897419 RepID=A0ABT0UID0_9ACTN|nr:ATP-binding protein [Streptomyces sp. CWNU-1]MCM2387977.1 ATP-binding protein [Streptomyces sp. CWNU-1]
MSLRLRLTALYSGLFLLAGGALLTITYLLVARALPQRSLLGGGPVEYGGLRLELPESFRQTLDQEATEQRSAALGELLAQSAVALTLTTVIAVVLGWLMAGRVLRPLRQVIDAAHGLSPDNLHERIELHRPDDEFRELADTMNAMLARLDAGFAFQRRFAATASHELRTPLTVQRSAVEVALADPNPSVESLRRMATKVIKATERHERLIDSLLLLARSQEGIVQPAAVDLATVAAAVIDDIGPDGEGVRITRELRPGRTLGDQPLLERLAANLVENAVTNNVPGGWVHIRTGTHQGYAMLEVTNSGPYVPPAVVGTLFEPFRRHEENRPGPVRTPAGQASAVPMRSDRKSTKGVGLGLAIVSAITSTHRGWINARSRADGGLQISVGLPTHPTGH